MSDDVTVGVPYAPPSNTVIRTQFDGWYYVPDTATRAFERIEKIGGDWISFRVIGNEATKVYLRKSAITAIVDLTQES
jgi:hypothetical protein